MTSGKALVRISAGIVGFVLALLVCLLATQAAYERYLAYMMMTTTSSMSLAVSYMYTGLAVLCIAGLALTARWSAAGLLAASPLALAGIACLSIPALTLRLARVEVTTFAPSGIASFGPVLAGLALTCLAGFGVGMLLRRLFTQMPVWLVVVSICATPLLMLTAIGGAVLSFTESYRLAAMYFDTSSFTPLLAVAALSGLAMLAAGVAASFSRWSLLAPAAMCLLLWGVMALASQIQPNFAVRVPFADAAAVQLFHDSGVVLVLGVGLLALLVFGYRAPKVSGAPVDLGPGWTSTSMT